jgi:DNA mismatch repair protein MutS
VIEAFLPKDQPFIPNNLSIGEEDNSHYWLVHIITWPNMWWKSTYLRQSALIVLMTHCWLFVPAQSARIWLVDGIFARVWSWDIIAKNQSTFMTEMIEVSNILNNSTENSFIIFDELWRWTSTYDWLALTRAILHYILTEIKAKTLIATHYHELIALENESSLIKNFSVWVYETEKEVVFMKKITSWWANKSYWVDVAKIAWIPLTILEEARNYLKLLESTKDWVKLSANQPVELFSLQKEKEWIDLGKYEKIKAYLKGMDLNSITPLQALQILVKIKWDL